MGFFDQTIDPTDPNALAALRIRQAIAQSAMPTPYRTPLFSGFGAIAGAKADAAEEAMKNKASQQQLMGGNLGLMQQLQQYNLIAPFMGGQPLTMEQLSNLKLGGKQPQGASETGGQTQSAPYGMPMGAPMAGTIPGQGQTTGNAASPAAPSSQGSPLAQSMMMRLLGFQQNDLQKAQLAAQMLPPGSQERQQADAYVRKLEGYDNSANVRSGGVQLQYNPATEKMEPVFKNPNLPQGFTIDDEGNAVPVKRAGQPAAESHAPEQFSDFASQMNKSENSTGNPAAKNAASSATGNGQFIDKTWLQTTRAAVPQLAALPDDQLLAMRKLPGFSHDMTAAYASQNAPILAASGQPVNGQTLALAHRFGPDGAKAILSAPPTAPMTSILPPDVIRANPHLAGMTAGQYVTQMGKQFGTTPVVQPSASKLVQSPLDKASPVQTPVQSGSPNIPSDLNTFEQHAAQHGVQFKPLPDALDTEIAGPVKEAGLKDMAAADADRLEHYATEAAGGQKVYTNLQQLYQILGRGLNTGNATETATHLANYAQQFGMSNLIPKDFDPNDSAAFNKLATDLVFAQLKQIGGRPMVSEIEGLRKANPNVGMPPAANLEILNNLLADQKWKDARAQLGSQFFQKYGYLTPFDSAFNRMYPETDVYNAITKQAAKSGLKLPGSEGTPSGRGLAIPQDAIKALKEGHITTFKNGQKWTLKNGEPEKIQ